MNPPALVHRRRRPDPRAERAARTARGLTLVEVVSAMAVAAVLAGLAVPAFHDQERRAARLDAVQALARVQQEQERHRAAHGLYASDLQALRGVTGQSAQGRYALSLQLEGPEAYVATARAVGRQADDRGCATMTLSVRLGFAQTGPEPACWPR